MIPLVDLRRQYQNIKAEVDAVIKKVTSEGNFILGRELEEFERNFASYCGTKHCVGVGSGTDAIFLSLRALGVGPGDGVITVPNTFIATVFPIVSLGAKPVLVDIDPATYQMDMGGLVKAITKKTKVILPVHLYGIPNNMDMLLKIAREHKLFVLEDACQAHGAMFKGRRCGSFGILAAFSFYPGKNLGAAGDGGAITTDDGQLAEKIRAMRNIGQKEKYKHDLLGYNSRLDTLQAAVLSVKLKRLDKWNEKRRRLAALYNKLLADLPVVLPPQLGEDYAVNYHLYVIRTQKRDSLLEFLRTRGIFCGIHYPIPVHLQKSLAFLGYKEGDFPISEQYSKELLSLPMSPELAENEVVTISQAIHEFFQINSYLQFRREFDNMHKTVARLKTFKEVEDFFKESLSFSEHAALAKRVASEIKPMKKEGTRRQGNGPLAKGVLAEK